MHLALDRTWSDRKRSTVHVNSGEPHTTVHMNSGVALSTVHLCEQ